MNENLKSFTEQTIKSLEYINANGVKEHIFDIDCSELGDYNKTKNNVLENSKTKPFYDDLKKLSGPVLYWFEIMSDIDSDLVVNALRKFAIENKDRTTPFIKETINSNSKILYVGKVKRSFYGRVIQHLGYHKAAKTQGLQLYYWGKPLSLKVRIHAIEFEADMVDMMPAVEQYFANALKPLVGKHI